MGTTYTVTGSIGVSMSPVALASVDASGNLGKAIQDLWSLASAGGQAPTMSGWLHGTFIAAAGDLLLAHASDPLQAMGDAAYFPPGFLPSGSAKIKAIRIRNNDASNTVTVTSKASVGAPIFDALAHGVTLQANGGELLLIFPAGTTALTTGSNDALTIAVGGGSPSCEITVFYGP